MKLVQLKQLTKEILVEDTQQSVQLSPERKNEIEAFWKKINADGTFYRGEAFHVDSIREEEHEYRVRLKRTDYAHYLHTVKNQITDKESCKVIFGAGLVETADSKYIFGEMADHTAYPGRLQCVGGGLSWKDKEGHTFCMKRNVLRELEEELGVAYHKHVHTCEPHFIKQGGTHDSIVILHLIKLKLTHESLKELYRHFTDKLLKKGERPEFQTIIDLNKDKESIQHFLNKDDRPRTDYLKPFLIKMTNEN